MVYNVPSKIPKESYFSIINSICNKYDIIIDINMNHKMVKENISIVNENALEQGITELFDQHRYHRYNLIPQLNNCPSDVAENH